MASKLLALGFVGGSRTAFARVCRVCVRDTSGVRGCVAGTSGVTPRWDVSTMRRLLAVRMVGYVRCDVC